MTPGVCGAAAPAAVGSGTVPPTYACAKGAAVTAVTQGGAGMPAAWPHRTRGAKIRRRVGDAPPNDPKEPSMPLSRRQFLQASAVAGAALVAAPGRAPAFVRSRPVHHARGSER